MASVIRVNTINSRSGLSTVTFDNSGAGIEVAGIVTARTGIHIDDSIVHIGDTNTKIRFPGADQIQLDTGGTNYLKLHRYASVNFVEVGASASISLANNGANARAILIGDGDHTSTGRILMQAGAGSQGHGGAVTLYSHANSTNAGGVYIGKSLNSSGSIIFGNGGTSPNSEFVRITSAGRVGIGEDSPDSLLHIKANNDRSAIRLENTYDSPDNVWELNPGISGVSNTGFCIRDVTDSANRFVIDGSGYIGIGINAPGVKLDVAGVIQSTDSLQLAGHPVVSYASFTDISGGSYATRLGSTGTSTLRSTQIYGGGSHIATFDGVNTRLGINETSPDDRIEIRTTAHGQGITIKSTGNTSNALTFDANRGTGGVIGCVYGRWNGTTVAQMHFVSGANGTPKNDGYITFGTESAASNGNVNATERLRISATGKITNTYDATPSNAQYGQIEITKSGASNVDTNWSYLSFHRTAQIAWQQGIDSNAFVIGKTGGSARDTIETERLRITSAGNIGQSVTPSGWSTAQANDFFAYQIGSGMAMFGRGSGDLDRGGISVNYFHTASATKYIGNGNANRIYMEDGSIVFSSAAANSSGADAAMTLNERMKIDVNGKILLGTTRTQYTNDYYDDITINNSGGSGATGGTGITMISNSNSWGALQFGDESDDDAAYIKYDHNGNKFIFGIEDGSVRFWQTKAKTWFGTTGHGDGSRSTLFDLVGENQDPAGAWGQMGIYSSTAQAQDRGGSITFGGQDGTTARQYFAGIQGAKENGTGGNYAGNLNFFTRPSGAVPKRRLRIESWGQLTSYEGPTTLNGNNGKLASGHCSSWNSTHMSGGLAVGWYPIIHLTDGAYLFMLKTGAHSSILFTASNGYDPSNVSYINVLHYTNNRNSSYLNVDGLRATSDGVIEVHLTASSSDYFEMQCQILGPEKIATSLSFNSTLTKNTGSPTVNDTKYPLSYGTGAMQLENVQVDGALNTSGSKNFRIPHPLSSLTGTKDLVHAAVEGPRADLIYRDKVDLVGGTATINIDTVAGMTEGTFAVLTKNAQCFTTNETGWTNVKGSISGNALTITAQDNSCTDTISWMVVAQRKDANIISASATDSNGDLILEPPSPLVDTSGQAPDDSIPNLT